MSVQDAIEINGDPTALYRLFDADGRLLYVGVTRNITLRFAQHEADKSWWPEVARKTMTWHGSRSAALAAEAAAVLAEAPAHNVAGKPLPEPLSIVMDAGPEYAYVWIADNIEERIHAGELAAGTRLLGERALAAEYGASPGTIRNTLRLLRQRGSVVTTPSKGTFVRAQISPASGDNRG